MNDDLSIAILSGGVGGARLVDAMARGSDARLTVIVNTGDDFEHLGVRICPDLDTVMYTLADLAPPQRGWGLREETFGVLQRVRELGGPGWFQLGDRDLATHLLRRQWLDEGLSLSEITRRLFDAHGVALNVVPMSDTPQPTFVRCADGRRVAFQDWLVGERAVPKVESLEFTGDASLSDGAKEALEQADITLIAPSNPWTSIHPILRLEGVRERIDATHCVGISPLIGGAAVKGPLAAMIASLRNETPRTKSIVEAYGGLLDALVVHPGDTDPLVHNCEVWEHDIHLAAPEKRADFGAWLSAELRDRFPG